MENIQQNSFLIVFLITAPTDHMSVNHFRLHKIFKSTGEKQRKLGKVQNLHT